MTDEPSLGLEEMRAILARSQSDWARALAASSPVTRDLRIAGVDVRVVLAGDELGRGAAPRIRGPGARGRAAARHGRARGTPRRPEWRSRPARRSTATAPTAA